MKIKLETVCKRIYAGGDVPKSSFSEVKTDQYNIPIYANAEKNEGLYGYTDVPRETELSITVAARGTIGYTVIRREPFLPVVRLITIVPDLSKVSERYLYYLIKNCKTQSSGTSIPQLTVPDIKKTFLDDIGINEQELIANKLDKVSRIIDLRKQELQRLDELIKARFVEMFGDMVLNPNNWDKYHLGELCDVRDGTHDSPQYYEEGYPLVTSKNVTNGKIDITNCNFISLEDYRKINQRSKVDVGDILMPMIGTVGNPVIVDIEPNFAIKNVALIKFKRDTKVLNSFVKVLLESDYFDNAVISKIRGGTQKFISLGDIRKLDICLPPIEVQRSFEQFIKQIDKSKFSVMKGNASFMSAVQNLTQYCDRVLIRQVGSRTPDT